MPYTEGTLIFKKTYELIQLIYQYVRLFPKSDKFILGERKKEALINEKKDLQEKVKDFAAGGDNWFERAKDFVTDLNRVSYALREGDLESQREILEKIGSNFILKERRLNFSSEGTFRHYLSSAPYQTWRGIYLAVRSYFRGTSEITA